MNEVSIIGLDLAKKEFQVHGADGAGKPVFRKKLRRAQLLKFPDEQPTCVVAMEVSVMNKRFLSSRCDLL